MVIIIVPLREQFFIEGKFSFYWLLDELAENLIEKLRFWYIINIITYFGRRL
jgi:hypothetical protein